MVISNSTYRYVPITAAIVEMSASRDVSNAEASKSVIMTTVGLAVVAPVLATGVSDP